MNEKETKAQNAGQKPEVLKENTGPDWERIDADFQRIKDEEAMGDVVKPEELENVEELIEIEK